MSKFLPTSGFKWIDREEFDLNKYDSNSLKVCVFKIDVKYHKELRELPLVPGKIEIKEKILSSHQLQIADLCNITIGNVKKLVPKFFARTKSVVHYKNLKLYMRLGLKLKKNASCTRTPSHEMAKTIC